MSSRIHKLALAAVVAGVCAVSGAAHAQARRCADLPPVAVDEAKTAQLFVFHLPRIASAKELYLKALCGALPGPVWSLVDRGEGAMVEIPASLADALDRATPYLPPVRFMYVRGGGPHREVIVVLMTDGYDGPFFVFDHNEPWNAADAVRAEQHWNMLPYEFIRQSTRLVHDVARFRESYQVRIDLGLFEIKLFEQGGGRGLANPMGTIFGSTTSYDNETFFVHELAHYLNQGYAGPRYLAWVDDYTGLARRNAVVPLVNVPIPFFFKLRFEEMATPEEKGVCERAQNNTLSYADFLRMPWGFTSLYSRCGELPVEDFADSVCAALGATQALAENPYGSFVDGTYTPDRLFERSGVDDSDLMSQRASWMKSFLGYSLNEPQDADGDGIMWEPGRDSGVDCNDINPVVGRCRDAECSYHRECDDHDPCTIDLCGDGNRCIHQGVDADHDGSVDTRIDTDGDGQLDHMCPGADCDSADPNVGLGTDRACTDMCGFASQQVCTTNGSWSECAGPESCSCTAGQTKVIACGNRCGIRTLSCAGGSWNNPGSCDAGSEGVCAAGARTFVRTVERQLYCAGGGVVGVERFEMWRECRPGCDGWVDDMVPVGRDEVTQPEVCDGADNDCDGTRDEGCPDGIRFGTPSLLPLLGIHAGTRGSGSCGANEVLVGVDAVPGRYSQIGYATDILYALRPVCASADLTANTSTRPYSYQVTLGTNRPLGWYGASSTTDSRSLRCGQGAVVVGINARADRGGARDFLETIQLVCASMRVEGTRGAYALAQGATHTTQAYINGTPDEHARCGSRTAATGLTVLYKTGATFDPAGVKGVQLQCAAPIFELQ